MEDWIDADVRRNQALFMHGIREIQSLAIHRRVVERLVSQPDMVINKALDNLRRWLAAQDDGGIAVYHEW